MKRRTIHLFIIFLLALGLPLLMAGPPAHAQDDLSQLIVGEWKLAPNKRATEGSIVFSAGGTYELFERLHDGTGVTTKGGYQLNVKSSPSRIDLCVGKCGQPGSEWTTRFGIIKVLGEGKLQIQTSPDGKYPSAFPEDTTGKYTMILTR